MTLLHYFQAVNFGFFFFLRTTQVQIFNFSGGGAAAIENPKIL